MPTRYAAKDAVFDPAVAEIMTKAFSDALERLRQSRIQYPGQDPEWVPATLALRIIETVQKGGERDPERIRDDALSHLAHAKPPSRT